MAFAYFEILVSPQMTCVSISLFMLENYKFVEKPLMTSRTIKTTFFNKNQIERN